MNRTILFLCTGNYYRSRFAEEVFNHHAAAKGLAWQAESRALAIERGIFNVGAMSAHAAQGLTARGIVPRGQDRMPQALSLADLERADRVIALKETEHRPLLRERFSAWCERVEYWEVHDLDQSSPAETLVEIEARLSVLLTSLIPIEPT